MDKEVWVGRVEVRQLPGGDHKIVLSGKGAFTWVTCWAIDRASYEAKVSEVMANYGLFIVDFDHVMPFVEAERKGLTTTDKLFEQFRDASALKFRLHWK